MYTSFDNTFLIQYSGISFVIRLVFDFLYPLNSISIFGHFDIICIGQESQ